MLTSGSKHPSYGTIGVNSTNSSITLTWQNVNVHSPEDKGGIFSSFGKKKPHNSRNHIIQNVNGIAKPGQIIAIMGASGAGKTTLLNVLTFRNKGNLRITGDVKINGNFLQDPSQLAAISGYVQQDDVFIGTLKVKEHLKFQAMLRMDRNVTKEEKLQRVEEVMTALNLKKCEDTLIGLPAVGVKGISGGEKRRLAFASEIITNPGILFCDEPTSGLDSFMAMSIVESMKNLANQGKTIICTIHQPSSEIFEKFDRLLLMAEGRLAFIGDLPRAYDFFSSQSLVCPTNYNPADYYINSLAISPFNREKSQEKVKRICDSFETSKFAQDLTDDINQIKPESNQINLADYKNAPKYKSNSFVQLKWLIWRNFLGTARNPMDTKTSFYQTIFMAVIFGLTYLRLNYDQEGVQNLNGVVFLIVTNTTFANIFPVINSFPIEVPIFLREHGNGMYRVINYYLAKLLSELPRFIFFPFLFATIVYWMSNLNNDLYRYLICCGVVILNANAAVSFGSFISASASSVNTALAIASPILAPLMIFSGFFLNNESIPSYFVWVKYISWINYSNEILVINQWDNIESIKCENNSTRCFRNGDDVLDFYQMKKGNFYLDLGLVCALIVAYRLLAYFALLIKSYKR